MYEKIGRKYVAKHRIKCDSTINRTIYEEWVSSGAQDRTDLQSIIK